MNSECHTDPFALPSAIDKAAADGVFDNLPLSGKPLNLPATHDPDWWIKQRIEDGDVDRDALLPTVVLLRKERERMVQTVGLLRSEADVRAHIASYNERVKTDRRENPHPALLAPVLDEDEWVRIWLKAQDS